MFTGIIQGFFPLVEMTRKPGLFSYSIDFHPEVLKELRIGASISVNGVCQSVVKIVGTRVGFDAIQETLNCTTVQSFQLGQCVNIERAAKWGDEIGGHFLSGHVVGRAQILKIESSENNRVFTFQCLSEWMKYLFSKGFIALDGVSLTLGDVNPQGTCKVHLIPETLRVTTFGHLQEGDWVNVEIDSQTQAIVETVNRILLSEPYFEIASRSKR